MLVKLAFVMQKLKKYQKIFLSWSTKMGGGRQFLDFMGGHSCYEGGHRALGGSPQSPPPSGKTLLVDVWFMKPVFKEILNNLYVFKAATYVE